MKYDMPVRVYEEAGCVLRHAAEIGALGSCALIVTGRTSARTCGALSDVQQALEQVSLDWTLFDEVEENPSIGTVVRGSECGRQASADLVIAIGGGSAMDAAKAIAVLMANEGAGPDFLDEQIPDAAQLPVVAVPTTCGTGSEVTGVAVLTRHEKKTKGSMAHRVYPRLALLDVRYLKAAPEAILRNTAADAFAHMVESWLNTNATDFSRAFVREGMRLWTKAKPVLLGERDPVEEDLRALLLASTYAGMAIAHTGTSLPHGLSYDITYRLGIAHGKACAYFLGGYLAEAKEEQTDALYKLCGFCDAKEVGDFLDRSLTLSPLPKNLLQQTANNLRKNEAKLKNCPFPVDEDVLGRIAGL